MVKPADLSAPVKTVRAWLTRFNPRQGESLGHRLYLVGAFVAPLCLLSLAAAWWYVTHTRATHVRLATGERGGTYRPLGEGIAEILERRLRRAHIALTHTHGSAENMALLERGEVEVAFVQSDTPSFDDVRTIAPLYEEVLQILVRDPEIQVLEDLEGRRIALGLEGSGSSRVAAAVFDHFDLRRFEGVHLGIEEGVTAFRARGVDAVCVLAGLRTHAVERILDEEGVRLLPLGDVSAPGNALEGLNVRAPFLRPTRIPTRAYGHTPLEPIGAVAVDALLVTRRGVDPELIQSITRQLFENRVTLARHHPVAAHLGEPRGDLRFPLHEGAERYYRRHEPSMMVRYAPAFSFFFSLLLTLVSALLGVREWLRRTKKNRIDVYYLALEHLAEELRPERDREELRALRRRLLALRKEAFHQLVAERLVADQAFIIFHDFLRTQMAEVDQRIRDLELGESFCS